MQQTNTTQNHDTTTEPTNGVLVRRMLGLAWRYRLGCLKALGLQLIVQALKLAGLGLTGLGIDLLRYKVTGGRWPLGWLGVEPAVSGSGFGPVAAVAGAALVAALAHAWLMYLAMVCDARLVQDIIVALRTQVYDKLQRLSFRFFDANQSGSIINRVTADVQAVRLFVDNVLLEGIVITISLVFYLVYMLNIHALLAVACLASTPAVWAMMVVFTRIVRPAYRRSRQLADHMVLCLSENIQGVHVVKGFARQDPETQKFKNANLALKDQQHWIFWRVSTFIPSITFMTYINQAVLLGYGGYLVIQDRLPLGGGLLVFAGILQQLAQRVSDIGSIANSVQRSLTGAARVFEVIDEPVEIASPPTPAVLPAGPLGVAFENVQFAYSDGQRVLHNIDLHVQPGQVVAITGPVGSGKSTLLSLVPRFYDAHAGRVCVGGVPVRDLDLDTLRRNTGVVFQENFLFSNTIAANIAFGHPEATRHQIETAARTAAIHDFILTLPDGYDTVIGENGVDLSGGQRQRLAIARAVLLDPAVLLLDDPTAGVDPQTEQEILEAMTQAVQGRTTLIVTHRLSTLSLANRVVVMDNGRIVQEGSHEELLTTAGHYQELAQLQLSYNPGDTPPGTPE